MPSPVVGGARRGFALIVGALLTVGGITHAQSQAWLPAGDVELRHYLQLLSDAGVISTPISSWPNSWPDIERAVTSLAAENRIDPSLVRVLERMRAEATRAAKGHGLRADVAGAQRPTQQRHFASTPREEAQVSMGASWLGERLAMNLQLTAAANPADDRELRLDGSYVGATFANWMVSAGSMERWWGPGWEGSLILSNNARPIPSVAIERKYSDPFESALLRWIGPWRLSAAMGYLEGSEVAVADALFFAARVTLRPRTWLEVGLSRTAQWCGEGRPCDLGTFGDVLLGRDNSDATSSLAEEPGNQMAGYDLRVRSPWQALPVALYAQMIGEDEAGGLPSKFLGLFGAEAWGALRLGTYRLHAEYADTSCNFSREQPQFNCAYRHALYPQGYAYRGRAIGHSLAADGRMASLGVLLARPGGASWSLLARRMELNRAAAPREELKDLELQYNRAFAWGRLGVGLGLEEPAGPRQGGSKLRGFVQWRQGF